TTQVVVEHEGAESAELIALVGDRTETVCPTTEYIDTLASAWFGNDCKRGWKIDNASGEPRAHAIDYLTQRHMNTNDCVVVDAYYAVYLWVGSNARHSDMTQAIRLAKDVCDLVQSDPRRNVHGCFKTMIVTEHTLSDGFKALFPRWTANTPITATSDDETTVVDRRTDVRRLTTLQNIYDSYEELFQVKTYSIEDMKCYQRT
ncbi:hypothetical protein SARC_13005, partial [Sphaeroforma arctica JP610]